jgi:hypothetical protein
VGQVEKNSDEVSGNVEILAVKGVEKVAQSGKGQIQVAGVSAKQLIANARQSDRVQDQLMMKNQVQAMEGARKRALEGILPNRNSFSILSNEAIAQLAANMGASMSEVNFDSIDIMKDLECAKQALDKTRIKRCPEPCEESILSDGDMVNEVPLLEWVDNDYEAEQFTLVQSKKKKRGCAQLGEYRLEGVRERLLHCTGVRVDRKVLPPPPPSQASYHKIRSK